MDPIMILAAMDGALLLVERLAPLLAAMGANGQITVEQQQRLQQRIEEIRNGQAFSGAHWQPSTGTGATAAAKK
jgi:hypothetical protein